jgi:iron complex outermembrane recepter protein
MPEAAIDTEIGHINVNYSRLHSKPGPYSQVFESSLVRTGVEYQAYTLYDWWPAVGGVMGPSDFWNIDYGRRRKAGLFAEWEGRLKDTLVAQVGVRGDRVGTDAAAVQGYDNGLAGAWGNGP